MRSRIWTPPEKQIWTPDDPEVGAVPCPSWSPQRMECNTRGLAIGIGLNMVMGGQQPDPKTIFGSALELWLRADMGITLNGGNVSAWADQSGSGDANKNVVQGTASQQPAYNTSDAGYAGKPTITFAGVNFQVLESGVWAVAPAVPGTFFIVANSDAAAATPVYCMFGAAGGVGELYRNVSTTDLRYYQGADAGSVAANLANKHVLGADRNGAASNLYQDATTAILAGYNAGASALSKLSVGAQATGLSALTGTIAELVSINRLATTSERTAVLKYLGARYGITIGP